VFAEKDSLSATRVCTVATTVALSRPSIVFLIVPFVLGIALAIFASTSCCDRGGVRMGSVALPALRARAGSLSVLRVAALDAMGRP
jgi:hypothetical protein